MNRMLQMQAVRAEKSSRGTDGIMTDIARDDSQRISVNANLYNGKTFKEKFSSNIDAFWEELFKNTGLPLENQNTIKQKILDYLTQSGMLEADREALGIINLKENGDMYSLVPRCGGSVSFSLNNTGELIIERSYEILEMVCMEGDDARRINKVKADVNSENPSPDQLESIATLNSKFTIKMINSKRSDGIDPEDITVSKFEFESLKPEGVQVADIIEMNINNAREIKKALAKNFIRCDTGTISQFVNDPETKSDILEMVSGRNANAAELALIAGHANRDAAVDTALIANAVTDAATLAVIVARNANAAELALIAGHANRDAAVDTALIANAVTDAATLLLIAGRNANAAELALIANHINADAAVDAALIANAATNSATLSVIANRTKNVPDLVEILRNENRDVEYDQDITEKIVNSIADSLSSRGEQKIDFWNLQAYIFLVGLNYTKDIPAPIKEIMKVTTLRTGSFETGTNYIEIYQAIVKYYEDLVNVTESDRTFAANFYNPPLAVGITALELLDRLDKCRIDTPSESLPNENSIDYHRRLLKEHTLKDSPHLPNPDSIWAEIKSITGNRYNPLFTGRIPYPLNFHAELPKNNSEQSRQQPMSVGTAVIHSKRTTVKLHPMFRAKLEGIINEKTPGLNAKEQLEPPPGDFEYVYINLQRDREKWRLVEPQVSSEVYRSRALLDNINKYEKAACLTLPADNAFYHQGFNPKASSGDNSRSKLEDMFGEIVKSIASGTNDFKIPDKILKRLYQKSVKFGYNPDSEPITWGNVTGELRDIRNLKLLLEVSFKQSVKSITGIDGPEVMGKDFDSETRCAVMLQFVKFNFTDQILNATNPQQFNISCKDAIDRAGVHNLILQINRKIESDETISQRDVEKYLDGLAMAYKHRAMNHHRSTFLNHFKKLYNHLPEEKKNLFKNSDGIKWAPGWINENFTGLGAVLPGESAFPGFTKVPKDSEKKDGGAQVKAEYTGFYTDDQSGQKYFIKKTGNKYYTGDDIAEILTARIGRRLLGSKDSRLIAECEPIRAVNGDVYVKSKCAPNWEVLHKHTRLGKNFTGALSNPTARSSTRGDVRRKIYEKLREDEDHNEKKELAKSLAMCLVLGEYDGNTENIGTSSDGIVKIDHGWGLVNILKDKHKKVELYEFKGLTGRRGGNLRATPTNHFLDYPDILSGPEFIESIGEIYTEFLSKGKYELQAEVEKSIRDILKAHGSVDNKNKTLLSLLKHISFTPNCYQNEGYDDIPKEEKNKMIVEEVAVELTKQISLRMHSMKIYRHTLDYKRTKEITTASDSIGIDRFNIVRDSIHGVCEALKRIEALEGEGHRINIEDYISEDCGFVLKDILSDLGTIVQNTGGKHSKEIMKMLPELRYIKERSQDSKKFKDKFTRPILSIIEPIQEKKELDEVKKRCRDEIEYEEAGVLKNPKKQKREAVADEGVPSIESYSEKPAALLDLEKPRQQHKFSTRKAESSAKARAFLPGSYDVGILKSSIRRNNKKITFSPEKNESHVITEQVLVRNQKKAIITYDPSREIPTEIESATTNPAPDELKIFADCIKGSGCRKPKFDRGNITDLIEVLRYLERGGYECEPEITTRMRQKANIEQQVILTQVCDNLKNIVENEHPNKRQKIERKLK